MSRLTRDERKRMWTRRRTWSYRSTENSRPPRSSAAERHAPRGRVQCLRRRSQAAQHLPAHSGRCTQAMTVPMTAHRRTARRARRDRAGGRRAPHVRRRLPPRRGPIDDGAAFLRFFTLYASHFHHAREEDTLFVALRDRAGLPADRGPIATMIADHERMAGLLAGLAAWPRRGADAEARLLRLRHGLRARAVAPHRRRELGAVPGMRTAPAPQRRHGTAVAPDDGG